MVHCAAIDCTNSSGNKNDESISLFKLPKDPEQKKSWISKLKRETYRKKKISTCVIFILIVPALKEILGQVVFFNHYISFIYVFELNFDFVAIYIVFFSSE